MTDEEQELLDILTHIGLMSLCLILKEYSQVYRSSWPLGTSKDMTPSQIFEEIMDGKDFVINNEKILEYGKKLKAYIERDNAGSGECSQRQ